MCFREGEEKFLKESRSKISEKNFRPKIGKGTAAWNSTNYFRFLKNLCIDTSMKKIKTWRGKECKPNSRAKRAYNYHWHYGITYEQRDELYQRQNGLCAICKKELNHEYETDHSHNTGLVRGLLCTRCNRGLGFFDDDIEIFKIVIDYLQRPTPVAPKELPKKVTTFVEGVVCKKCQTTAKYQNGNCVQCAKNRWTTRFKNLALQASTESDLVLIQ